MSVDPVSFQDRYVEPRSRVTTFFRLILAIPHFIVLALWGFAVFFVVIAAWFALLFTGSWPQGMYDFTASYLRYSTYVYGYTFLLTDDYPPFNGNANDTYPVTVHVGPPKPEYDRIKVAFRIFLLIPVFIIMYAMQLIYEIGAFLAWFAIVILGRQPKGLQDMIELGISYQQRAYAYALLLSEDFPPFTSPQPALGEGAGPRSPLPPSPTTPAAPAAPEAPTSSSTGMTGGDPLS
ncbi:MAG: DUF4389 domain-containing protein [Solirubrobacterales bacterium]|nr:DUF4389 domain-containing protein [Solirubrobacterales bacterium]